MARFAQPGDRFEPAEDLLDAFALLLAKQIAGMTSGPLINDSSGFASKVRGDLMVPQRFNKFLAVVAFVGAEGDSSPARDLLDHRQCRLRLGAPRGLCYAAVDRQAVAVFHQHVAGVAELGPLALTLASQQRLRIGGGLVGRVAAPLAVKVDARIAGIAGRGVLVRIILALETPVARPRFDQRSVDCEMLVREQAMSAGLTNHRSKKALRYLASSSRSRFLLNTVASHA